MPLCASVYLCLVATCWERAGRFALVCHFPIGVLGQVCYLIVSIPDLCTYLLFICIKVWRVRFADFYLILLKYPMKMK